MTRKIDYNQIFIKIAYVLAVAYLLYLTYDAVMNNYQTNKKITALKAEIELANAEEGYLQNLNVYYATNTYKELEARRKLGMKKPDEKVVRILIDPQRLSQIEQREVISKINTADTNVASNEPTSNARKWLQVVLRI
jgi:cell division protein FtsL